MIVICRGIIYLCTPEQGGLFGYGFVGASYSFTYARLNKKGCLAMVCRCPFTYSHMHASTKRDEGPYPPMEAEGGEDEEKATELKIAASDAMDQGDFATAVEKYSAAIKVWEGMCRFPGRRGATV